MILTTAATKNRAGRLPLSPNNPAKNFWCALLCLATLAPASIGNAQQRATPPLPAARVSAVGTPAAAATAKPATAAATARPSLNTQQSSVTVQQIVARQEAHFNTIKNAQGIAVHTETKINPQGQTGQPERQVIHFAFAGDKSVTLAMPESAAKFYGSSQGQIPWPQIIAATLISGDTVYSIRPPGPAQSTRTTTSPTVIATPYNPAVHDNNPLVAFHPRQVGDEQLPLRELARAIPQMTQRPTVTDVAVQGRPLLQIDFANPGTPGEHLYYLIDPNRGYLPVKISRMSNGKPISVSDILLAPTPEGYWMPARRERVTYDTAGKPTSRQSWHYEFIAINKGLAPMALTLMYFNLPMTTPVKVVNAPASNPTP